VSEEYVERPILEAGYHIGPELEAYIQNRSTEDRRYAISALGKIKYDPAIKTLESILVDGTEADYIRADAFMSLKSIATKEAERIIADFRKSGDKNVLTLTEKETKGVKGNKL
jgi:HEAT repeat protein